LRVDIAGLDPEHPAGGQFLTHDREYATRAQAMQLERLPHGLKNIIGFQKGFNLILVEQ
jgi:hypothetical protein